jgi:predicted nucleic acid-binding protein
MNPPSTLLDATFLTAVADTDDANHDEAVALYRTMVDDFVEQRCLLVARADHLAVVATPDLFAPVDKLHVARQHRHAADELVRNTGIDFDVAITLVLVRRSKIRKVATFDERLTVYDIDILTSAALSTSSAAAESEPS